ncbi:helix-turn-helix domain-containing protein [[Kitasatospora] papulosa]|uniref:helix-turn-helix domain-containing protein n=1 Tax=Streptomyces TaxID=1883 RepID=UPI0006912B5B|nr:helix-turn-helix transcriptional regulator [Streptomyces flavovirens]WSZ48525.1 helix-turn-helix domain-containing protein [[Kitasatospora] papulosa]
MTEQQYGRRAVETGPTGQTVAENLSRLRKARGFSTRQLAAALERSGRNISASGISRMEKAERHVNADELAAFAVIFGVSPSALLLPLTREGTVSVTGAGEVPASTAWEWVDGERPLVIPHGDKGQAQLEYRLWGRPPHLEGEPLETADRRLWDTVAGRRIFADNLEASGQEVQRYADGTIKSWRKPGGEWVGILPHISEEEA